MDSEETKHLELPRAAAREETPDETATYPRPGSLFCCCCVCLRNRAIRWPEKCEQFAKMDTPRSRPLWGLAFVLPSCCTQSHSPPCCHALRTLLLSLPDLNSVHPSPILSSFINLSSQRKPPSSSFSLTTLSSLGEYPLFITAAPSLF